MTPEEERHLHDAFTAWVRVKWDAGFAALHYPTEVGGRGLTPEHTVAFVQEEAAFDIPVRDEVLGVTTLLTPQAVLHHGSSELQRRFLPTLLRAEELCCQLFSEPEAGSDLASLRTTAQREGNQWIVEGQKLWSSGAHHARWGLLLARTDREARRHRGLTMFLIDMEQPAVNARQVRQMNGATSFCEVFFDHAVVPDELRIGKVGQGWAVAMTTLMAERLHTGARRMGGTFEQLVALARHLDRLEDPHVRQRLAEIYISGQVQTWNRSRWAGSQTNPAAGSFSKLMVNRHLRLIGDLAGDLLGARLVADTGDWGTFAWTEHILGAPGYRLAGGTEEIQRNIVGERMLGLPRGPL